MNSTEELPTVQVEGGINMSNVEKSAASKKQKPKQLRHSNYYITINTNQRYSGHEKEFAAKCKELESAILSVFSDHKGVSSILVFKEGDSTMIKDIRLSYAIELGDDKNCLHAHLTFNIAHYAKLSVDYSVVRKLMTASLGLDKIYMSNKLYRDSAGNLAEYMGKNKKKSVSPISS